MIYISDPYHIFNPHFCHLPQVLSPELAELLDGLLELHPEDRLCLGEFLGGVPLLGDFLEETRDWGKLGRRMGADVWCEPRIFSGICIGGQPFEQSEENAQKLAIFWSKSELECYKFEPDPFKTRAFIFDPELRCPVVNGYGDGAHIYLFVIAEPISQGVTKMIWHQVWIWSNYIPHPHPINFLEGRATKTRLTGLLGTWSNTKIAWDGMSVLQTSDYGWCAKRGDSVDSLQSILPAMLLLPKAWLSGSPRKSRPNCNLARILSCGPIFKGIIIFSGGNYARVDQKAIFKGRIVEFAGLN